MLTRCLCEKYFWENRSHIETAQGESSLQKTTKKTSLFPRLKVLDDFERSRSLVSNLITMSDFFLKPGTLLWTRTLGTITSHYQKPTKASREHELHGHTRKLCVTLLSIAYDNEFHFHFTDEGLSITRNICYQLSRVSGKPFTWQNLICVVMFLISSTDNITFHWMSQGLRQMKMSARCLAKWHCYSNSHLKKITPFVFITDFNHWCKNPGS